MPMTQKILAHRISRFSVASIVTSAAAVTWEAARSSCPHRRQNFAGPRIRAKQFGHSISMKVWAGITHAG